MHFTEYQHEAMSYRLPSANTDYALLNLAGEVGELLSKEAKLVRDGGNMRDHREAVLKEMGDVLWCLAAIASDYKYTLEDVAKANLHKLYNRKNNNTIQGNGDNR